MDKKTHSQPLPKKLTAEEKEILKAKDKLKKKQAEAQEVITKAREGTK